MGMPGPSQILGSAPNTPADQERFALPNSARNPRSFESGYEGCELRSIVPGTLFPFYVLYQSDLQSVWPPVLGSIWVASISMVGMYWLVQNKQTVWYL